MISSECGNKEKGLREGCIPPGDKIQQLMFGGGVNVIGGALKWVRCTCVFQRQVMYGPVRDGYLGPSGRAPSGLSGCLGHGNVQCVAP